MVLYAIKSILFRNRYKFSSTLLVLVALYVKYCSVIHTYHFYGILCDQKGGLTIFIWGKRPESYLFNG